MGLRRLRLEALGGLCALLTVLALSDAPASALLAHAYQYSFGSVGSPGQMAVDESTHDVYAIDGSTGTLNKLNAFGEPVEFSALHSSQIPGVTGEQIAVDNSSGPAKGDIYVAPGQEPVRIYGSDGIFLGFLGGPRSFSVGVDGSGNVYVGQAGKESGFSPEEISKYTPSQNPVTDTDLALRLPRLGNEFPAEFRDMVVDAPGDVYVVRPTTHVVEKFLASQFGELEPVVGVPFAYGARALAVDRASGNLLVDTGAEVAEYDPTGSRIGESFDSENLLEGGSSEIAVDGANGQVYVANNHSSSVDVFSGLVTLPDISVGSPSDLTETSATLNATINPDGVDASCSVEYGSTTSYGSTVACSPLDVGAGGAPVPVSVNVAGLEPATLYHYRFVTVSANGTERGRDQTVTSAALPIVDGEQITSVGSESATVQAQINPRLQHVSYHFEYGTDTSYGTIAPTPDSKIAVAEGDQTALWTLGGLLPGVSYHVRVLATDAFGTAYGPDRVFTTYPRATGGESCPNAIVRQQQFSSFLPNCRAYELVSPPEKNGVSIGNNATIQQSSVDGNAIKYYADAGFGGTYGSSYPGGEYVSERVADGWRFHPINPEQGGVRDSTFRGPVFEAFSDDLSKGVYYALTPVGTGHPNVENVANLYLRTDVLDQSAGNYELLTDSFRALPPRPVPTTDKGVAFVGASADFSHIIFETAADLTQESEDLSANAPKLYEWDRGTERLVGVLPDGTPAKASIAGRGGGGGPVAQHSSYNMTNVNWTLHSISRDGSRVVFVGPPFDMLSQPGSGVLGGNIYMRINHSRTIQLNVSELSTPEPGEAQPAFYWDATPDDSKVFFTTDQRLLDEVTGDNTHLYMYDVNAPEGKNLTWISVDREPADDHAGCAHSLNGSSVEVPADGVSDDGKYVYFVTHCLLVPGHSLSTLGMALYVWHDGVVRFIAEHSGSITDWGMIRPGTSDFRITPDGRYAQMRSLDPSIAERAGVNIGNLKQVFVYSYDGDRISCASCAPTGIAPVSKAGFESSVLGTFSAGTQYISRTISANGRDVFFDTADALTSQDTNGKRDVYEYDTATAKVRLISSGVCNCESLFVDASLDGRDVFFTTSQSLVRGDIDQSTDIYDARAEGGLASQNQAPAPPCVGDACQLAAEGPPDLSAPASSTFSGAGNVVLSPRPAVKSSPKQKAKKSKHKKSKRKKAKRKQRPGKDSKPSNHAHRRAGR